VALLQWPSSSSLSFLCVLLFLLFFFSLYITLSGLICFFNLYVFFVFGWLDQQPAMRESRSSIAGVLKESQKCLWFFLLSLCILFVVLCFPRSPLVSGLSMAFKGRENALVYSSYLPRIMILGMGISMARSSVSEKNKGPTILPLQDCW